MSPTERILSRIGEELEHRLHLAGSRRVIAAGINAEAHVRHGIQRMTRRVLHFVNLPAASDVRELADQVARLESAMDDVRHLLGHDDPPDQERAP